MYKKLGIYIHIPFCAKKCNYCDFNSFTPKENQVEQYIDALIGEMNVKLVEFDDYIVQTVFIGGGTPTYIPAKYISRIMSELKNKLESIRPGMYAPTEVTIECNPGTVNYDKLLEYKKAGINRISIGLQSADCNELCLLGRIHSFNQWKETVVAAKNAGFNNISTDLISGIPGQTVDTFTQSLDCVIDSDVNHISVYSLIIEEGTPFYDKYNPDKYTEEQLDEIDETDRKIYAITKEKLEAAGYYRYEISNYAKPGYESVHNIGYWTREEYIGFGISAASLIRNVRTTNTDDFNKYIYYYTGVGMLDFCYCDTGKSVLNDTENAVDSSMYQSNAVDGSSSLYQNNVEGVQMESLSVSQQMSEFMILGLRLSKGVSYERFFEEFGCTPGDVYNDIIEKWTELGYLVLDEDYLKCTDEALDVCNVIMSDFV